MSINRFLTVETLVYILLLYIKEVICITEPGELAGNVGGNVTFKWTATPGNLNKAEWGLYTSSIKTVIPLFISVPKEGALSYDSALDNKEASRYKGRVHFIGNISQGRAWFYLTNLELNDTSEYGVILSDKDDYPANYKVKLTVTVPPTTTSSPTTVPSTSTKPTTGSNITTTTPTTSSTLIPTTNITKSCSTRCNNKGKEGLTTGAKAGIGVAVVVVLGVIVFVVVYLVKKKKASHHGVRIPMTD